METPTVVSLEQARDGRADRPVFNVDLDGFEGPIDVLLTLARAQKVDLREISILELVEQYLAFIQSAQNMELDIAADYMVMAAWLTYLKSRLLLPKEDDEEEPSAEELAMRLQLQLQRLEAMREAGLRLFARDQLGKDLLPRGMPEGIKQITKTQYEATLYELLKGYAAFRSGQRVTTMEINKPQVYSLEDAYERLDSLLGGIADWAVLEAFIPESASMDDPLDTSRRASMFAAALELTKQGKAHLAQSETFGPLYLKAAQRDD